MLRFLSTNDDELLALSIVCINRSKIVILFLKPVAD